jgi:small-conductance mechanosensitive channel
MIIISLTIDIIIHRIIIKEEKHEDSLSPSMIISVGNIIKVLFWVTGILAILSNLGFDITALIAGLGIGGIAIAFALQGILGDLFASFSIYFDKPFKKGHFIIVDDDMGVVENIGLRSTRINTLRGEELVISNKELTSVRIHNFKNMANRRVVFKLGIEYS